MYNEIPTSKRLSSTIVSRDSCNLTRNLPTFTIKLLKLNIRCAAAQATEHRSVIPLHAQIILHGTATDYRQSPHIWPIYIYMICAYDRSIAQIRVHSLFQSEFFWEVRHSLRLQIPALSRSLKAMFLKLWSADHKWSSGSALVVLLDWTLVQKRQKK
jgi:hypothetical protein